jgi:hypothetical protein
MDLMGPISVAGSIDARFGNRGVNTRIYFCARARPESASTEHMPVESVVN